MTKPVINLSELTYSEFGKGDKFGAARAPVSPLIGSRKLGYAVIKLAPGKRAWPFHAHRVIEEMFYVIEGEGTLRHGDDEYPIKTGDFIASPPDPDVAHQIVNTSDRELTYVALSTQDKADIIHYPDSGKFGAYHGETGDPRDPGSFMFFGRTDSRVDYWDGEDD